MPKKKAKSVQVTVIEGHAAEMQEWKKKEKKLVCKEDEANAEMFRQHRIKQQLRRDKEQQ